MGKGFGGIQELNKADRLERLRKEYARIMETDHGGDYQEDLKAARTFPYAYKMGKTIVLSREPISKEIKSFKSTGRNGKPAPSIQI
jgi:hypothetical protein